MPTKGGFAATTERCKDIIVQKLRQHFGDLDNPYVSKEQVQIIKYGLAGKSPAESFINISTALPHVKQHIPTIAVMSAPGTERKLGIGRQVIDTFHHPVTGLPMIREAVAADINVIIEISAPDTNVRSELADITAAFFTVYAEETKFSFLGSSEIDPITKVGENFQIILQSRAVLQGETDVPRPGGEQMERIYYNRITIPLIFIDYVDREAFDIQVCFDPTLTPADDEWNPQSGIVAEPQNWQFVNSDDFETAPISTEKWALFTSETSIEHSTDPVIRGNGSVLITSFTAGSGIGLIQNRRSPGVLSGRIRTRFRFMDEQSRLVLYAMLQGPDPFTASAYYLVFRPGNQIRIELFKGPLVIGATSISGGSRIVVPSEIDLAAQFEWKIDATKRLTRLRGYISFCETDDFGAMQKRLEFVDGSEPYLTSEGEGFGFMDILGSSSSLLLDDPGVIREIGGTNASNPSRVRPR